MSENTDSILKEALALRPLPWASNPELPTILNDADKKMNIICATHNINEGHESALLSRIADCVNALEGVDSPKEFVELATAHREAVIMWETTLMGAIGEDGPASVVLAIEGLKQSITSEANQKNKLSDNLFEMDLKFNRLEERYKIKVNALDKSTQTICELNDELNKYRIRNTWQQIIIGILIVIITVGYYIL